MDFNDAELQMDQRDVGAVTLAPVSQTPFLTRSKNGDSTYLNCEFVVLEGQYAKRRIFDKIGVHGSDTWINMGKARIRAILESAKNINPKDMSETAMTTRKINSFGELDGLEIVIRIGIESDRNGVYQDKNKIISVITPDNIAYKEQISSSDIPWGAM